MSAPPPVALDSYASIVFMMSKFTIVCSCPDELLISWIDDESLEFLVKLLAVWCCYLVGFDKIRDSRAKISIACLLQELLGGY